MSETHDDCRFRDDAGSWVLDALDEPDAAAFAAHLGGCPECRREVADLQVVADVLPMAAPQAVPPPALKRRIMAVVDAEAELLAATGPEADRADGRAAARRRGGGVGERGGALGRLRGLRPLPAAALATAVLALGVVLGVVLAGSGGGDATTVPGFGPRGARVALRVGDGHGQLDFRNMSAPPSGRVYQVWLVTGQGSPRPTHALFTVMADGRARVEIPESLRGADQVLVTDEPPGGSRKPTGKVVAGAKLS
jgi:anti-sigma-K factor RskA